MFKFFNLSKLTQTFQQNYKRIGLEVAYNLSICGVLVFVVPHYFIDFTWCIGPSMKPTINENGQLVLIDVFSYKFLGKKYEAGDVVISKSPNDINKRFNF
jgi:signal peptidase I